MGPKSGRNGLLARQDMAQVSVQYKEVTPKFMNVKESKQEGKKEQKEQPGACHHHLAMQEAQQYPLGLQRPQEENFQEW